MKIFIFSIIIFLIYISYIKNIELEEEHVKEEILSINRTSIQESKIMNFEPNNMLSKLKSINFEDNKSIDLLKYLHRHNKILENLEEILFIINQKKNISDYTMSYFIDVVTSLYQGKDIFSEPSNERDVLIQIFLKKQLKNPVGEISFYQSIRFADILAKDYNLYEIIDNAIRNNKDILSTTDEYKFKLKYSDELEDILYNNLQEINTLPIEEQKVLKNSIYKLIEANDVYSTIHTEDIRQELKNFLENNSITPRDIDNVYKNIDLSSKEEVENYYQVFKEAENKFNFELQEYANWLEIYGKVEGKDPNDFMHEVASKTDSILKKIAIIEHVNTKSIDFGEPEIFENFYNDVELKLVLQDTLNNANFSPVVLLKLKETLKLFE